MADQPDQPTTPWDEPGWRARLRAWLDRTLSQHRIQISGAIEQPHVRPWSTVFSVPTDRGRLYLKACAPPLVHEARLVPWLIERWPDWLPQLIAAEGDEGWLLLSDCGPLLRPQLRQDRDLIHWQQILPAYAQIQRETEQQVDSLLAMGLPDRRPAVLMAAFEEVLRIDQSLPAGLPKISRESLDELKAGRGRLSQVLARLETSVVRPSLHHGDLHDANVACDGRDHRLLDWGDSSISHPFFSLRTVLVSIENSLGLPATDPACLRLRDAYLEPWTTEAEPAELRRIFGLAAGCWSLSSLFTWHRALAGLAPPARQAYAAIPSLAQELADSLAGRDWTGLEAEG